MMSSLKSSITLVNIKKRVIFKNLDMKGTKNLSEKRTIPARNAKANQRNMMNLTLLTAEGIWI